MKDIFGQALLDYYNNEFASPLLLHNEYGPPESVPLERYFLTEADFSELEQFAMQLIKGKTLDVGAATGRHAIYLQSQGTEITAMDISGSCCKLMKMMGVKHILAKDIFSYYEEQYDTLLFMMNGIGVGTTIQNLTKLLQHLKHILSPGGQVLMDSSDISYLYSDCNMPQNKYFGELTFQYEYKGNKGDPFNWLYIDQEKMAEVAEATGWYFQAVFEDETGAYLARLINME